MLLSRYSGFIVLRDKTGQGEETYWDDEEVDPNAPNPSIASDLDIPQSFVFDPNAQNA